MTEHLPEPKLSIELIPSALWERNVRTALRESAWDRLRKQVAGAAGRRCEICGGVGTRHPVECHERWEYAVGVEGGVQTLVGLIALCPGCHEVKHFGRTAAIGYGDRAMEQLRSVNGWDEATAKRHGLECKLQWEERELVSPWTADLSWLSTVGVVESDYLNPPEGSR